MRSITFSIACPNLGAAHLILLAWLACPWTAQSQPRLELSQPASGTLQFRWPEANAGYTLESTPVLSETARWTRVSGTPALAEGFHSLALPVGTETRFFRLNLTPPRYTRIESFAPPHGATGVDLEQGAEIRFTGPINADPVAAYAESGGIQLPVQMWQADERSLNFIFLTNLPPLSRVRLVVDGNRLRDGEGRRVDANNNDVPGGVGTAEFVTAGERPADRDGDSIPDGEELVLGTDPDLHDTDGDGFGDGTERLADYDPLSPDSHPGILLEELPGTIQDLMTNFPAYGPFPVVPQAVTAEGLIRMRIAAVLNPNTTPAIVNQALNAAGLRIVTMRPGGLFVSLALPARPRGPYDAAQIQAIAQALVQNSDLTPFLFADLAYTPGALIAPGGPTSPAATDLGAQDLIRMPAAWNLLAAANPATPVKVLVPDFYVDDFGHPQLPNQEFVPAVSGRTTKTGAFTPNFFVGNHGHAVVSAMASRFDDRPPTGTLPPADVHPQSQVRVLSMPIDRLQWADCLYVIGDALVREQPDLLSTSLGFIASPPPGPAQNRAERIRWALCWRSEVLRYGRQFLHFTAAGNDWKDPRPLVTYDREMEFTSPWNLAARRGALDHLLLGADGLTQAERWNLEVLYRSLAASYPAMSDPLDNVVIVGSVDASGSLSAFSELGEDIVAQGEGLTLACARAGLGPTVDSTCDGVLAAQVEGTSFAAPQVAGVAAYLLNLKRDLTPSQIQDILMRTRDGKRLDAYAAVLELDAGNGELPWRLRLLDVAGGEEEDATGVLPDGKFDEKDLEAFLNAFRDAEAVRGPQDPPDRSRYDLNGDGYTGGHSTARFDVDAAGGLQEIMYVLKGVPAELDERAVTDRELLCYFAHSPLYTGSISSRGELLGGECKLPPLISFKYTHGGGEGIRLITATKGTALHVIFHPERRFGVPVWRPDGGELAYWGPTATDTDIIASQVGNPEIDGSQSRMVTTGPASDASPVYLRGPSPIGDELYFARSTPAMSGIWMAKAPLQGVPRLLASFGPGEGIRFPFANIAWQGTVSADNRWAFGYSENADGSVWSLRTIDPNGAQNVLVPGLAGSVLAGFWAPDDEHVAYVHGGKVWLVSSKTLVIRELAGDAYGNYRVGWSPDGRHLAYISLDVTISPNLRELSAVDLQGGPTLRFSNTSTTLDFAWSPAGDEIAFTRDNDIWVRRLDTGAERRLTFSPNVPKEGLEWRPGTSGAP